jgi:adenylate cyclase
VTVHASMEFCERGQWNEATKLHFSGDPRQAIAIQRIQDDLCGLYGEARPEVVSGVRPRLP